MDTGENIPNCQFLAHDIDFLRNELLFAYCLIICLFRKIKYLSFPRQQGGFSKESLSLSDVSFEAIPLPIILTLTLSVFSPDSQNRAVDPACRCLAIPLPIILTLTLSVFSPDSQNRAVDPACRCLVGQDIYMNQLKCRIV